MSVERGPDNTKDILKDIERNIEKALTAAGLVVEANMKDRAPIKLGNLKRSITAEPGKDAEGAYVDIGPGTDYAEYVEYGTYKMAAQPYAKPGFDASIPKVNAILERELRR